MLQRKNIQVLEKSSWKLKNVVLVLIKEKKRKKIDDQHILVMLQLP